MTQNRPIYLDYAATTPVDPRVAEKMHYCLALEGPFGNSTSHHSFGQEARQLIEGAREAVAHLLQTVSRNIIFTSGATEANNLAIKGIVAGYPDRGKHLITCRTEHKAVLDVFRYLETQGYSVTYLDPKPNGLVDCDVLNSTIRADTVLVSIMHVNNETGVIQDINRILQTTRERGVFLHVDAAQSLGKIAINLQQLPVDLLSFSAHKFYGPKGIGGLYVGDSPRVRLVSQSHGGGQERKLRAGTLATHQIVGMGEACRLAAELMSDENRKIQQFRDQFWQGIGSVPGLYLNTEECSVVPHILNVRFSGLSKAVLLERLQGLAISFASACNTLDLEPSHVLRAMGYSEEEARSSIRFSFGRFTTEFEIQKAITLIRERFIGGLCE